MIEAAPPAAHPSLLTWTITSLGPIYLILLLLAGLVSFMLALAILVRGRGPFAAAALVLVVPAPMLIGLFAAVDGIMRSFTVIAMSTSTPKPSEMAAGVSTAIVASL
ncbi:MAG: MotA/TolQ/ExbB proton channel family protein, partial [Planctomycetales bacterium]|nr:MotA/TolQ/ExbB proton channel family protein [Planctomycetales bacterium]